MVRLQTKNRNFLLWIRRHKFLSLFCVIVLLVIGVFVYEKVALELNKRAFQQARVAIDTIYADIVAKVGQPDDHKRTGSCSIYTEEFSTGPTFCNIDTSFIYSVTDEGEANRQFKSIQSVISLHKEFKPSQALDSAITSKFVVNTNYYAASDKYKSAGLDCIVNYVYDTPREISLEIHDNTKKPLQVVIGCNSLARSKYYPITQ